MSAIQVYTKASKWNNRTPKATEYTVEVDRNSFIGIYKDGVPGASFRIGDLAEYGSYNLIYTGNITKITDKMVQITAYQGTLSERRHNLSLYEFCYKNYRFDAAKVNEQNAETSMYI